VPSHASPRQGRVSIELTNETLEAALNRLLAEVNFAMILAEPPATGGVLVIHSMKAESENPSAGPMRIPALEAWAADELNEFHAAQDALAENADDRQEMEEDRQALQAIEARGTFKSDVRIESIRQLLQSDNLFVRRRAIEVLSGRETKESLTKESLGAFLDALMDDDYEVRRSAIRYLGRQKDKESIEALGSLIRRHPEASISITPDASIYMTVLEVYALRADPACRPYVERLRTTAPDEDVREAAQQIADEFARRAGLPRRPEKSR